MNIYARYFEQDILAHNTQELIDFLSRIPDIQVNNALIDDINRYANSDIAYPKRYKVRPRVYFILIKTNANSLEEFRENKQSNSSSIVADSRKESRMSALAEIKEGWYKGSITFKRVIQNPETGKFQYQDTTFTALTKAKSGQDCYDRITDHLKSRPDIDARSQIPSAKGNNFKYAFVSHLSDEDIIESSDMDNNQDFIED